MEQPPKPKKGEVFISCEHDDDLVHYYGVDGEIFRDDGKQINPKWVALCCNCQREHLFLGVTLLELCEKDGILEKDINLVFDVMN